MSEMTREQVLELTSVLRNEDWNSTASSLEENDAQQREELKLLAELVSVLSNHCGKAGVSEGAVDTLTRIIAERATLQAELEAAQQKRPPLTNPAPAELTREQVTRALIDVHHALQGQPVALMTLVKLDDYISSIRSSRDEYKRKYEELEEWKRIILGTGTDQEAVIRLAATEYTNVAVESWRREVDALTQQLAEVTKELAEAKCGEDLCGHDHSTQYWELRANKAECLASEGQEAIGHYQGEIHTLEKQLAAREERVKELEGQANLLRGDLAFLGATVGPNGDLELDMKKYHKAHADAGGAAMSFSYAVIRQDGDGWHLSVNDFSKTHEVTKKTLPDILKEAQRLITEVKS